MEYRTLLYSLSLRYLPSVAPVDNIGVKFTPGHIEEALRFETNGVLLGMLTTMSKYGLSDDYIKQDESIIKGINSDRVKAIIDKYIIADKMVYVVVGDASTQFKQLEKTGFGKPILIKP